jgi:hypothetical protein
MFHLTAPVTKRQLELLQARKRLERRMSYDTLPANGYGLAARVEVIDAELAEIEQSKGKREVAA